MQGEPEVFWCSYCGKNIWVVAETIIDPAQLICEECKQKKENYRD